MHWIMTQDGMKLLQPRRLVIQIGSDKVTARIVDLRASMKHTEDYDVLGLYESVDRAKEVLQDMSKDIYYYVNDSNFNLTADPIARRDLFPVFQMPIE